MDVQIKIKILKSFDHGLQNLFLKNKEERIYQNLWLIKGLRPSLRTPLSKPLVLSKKRRYKKG
jgi:hypothetical protein